MSDFARRIAEAEESERSSVPAAVRQLIVEDVNAYSRRIERLLARGLIKQARYSLAKLEQFNAELRDFDKGTEAMPVATKKFGPAKSNKEMWSKALKRSGMVAAPDDGAPAPQPAQDTRAMWKKALRRS